MSSVLKLLILSDFLIYVGLGLTSSLSAIYITNDLVGGTIAAVGISAAIFLIIKSVSQIIFAKVFNSKDILKMVIGGTMLIIITPFIWAFSTNIYHIFLAQVIYGLGAGLAAPAWMNLFVNHLSKKRPGFEWSVYSTIIGLGTGASAYLGAILVNAIGFRYVFLIMGVLAVSGMLVLFKLTEENLKLK